MKRPTFDFSTEAVFILEKEVATDFPRIASIHTHSSGNVPPEANFAHGHAEGIVGYGNLENYLQVVGYEGVQDLDAYLERTHFIEKAQMGPRGLSDAILAGARFMVEREGRVGDKSLFGLSGLAVRTNCCKRTYPHFVESGGKKRFHTLFDLDAIMLAANAAAVQAESEFPGVTIRLVLSLARDQDLEVNTIHARKCLALREQLTHFVGVDLAGPEGHPALDSLEGVAALYRELADTGLETTMHLGETRKFNMPEFIRQLRLFKPKQVAHPIHAVLCSLQGDDSGLRALKEAGVLVEICHISNWFSGIIADIETARAVFTTLDDFQIPYSLSTDSAANHRVSLAEEIAFMLTHNILSVEQIHRALGNAEKSVLLPT